MKKPKYKSKGIGDGDLPNYDGCSGISYYELLKTNWYNKKLKEESCLHDGCSQCHGTGKKQDGTICIHFISCPCPKCTPRC